MRMRFLINPFQHHRKLKLTGKRNSKQINAVYDRLRIRSISSESLHQNQSKKIGQNEAIFYHRLFSKTVNSIDSHFCTSVIFTVTANNKVDQIFLIKITSPPLTCTLQPLAFFKKTDEKKFKLL